MTEAFISTWSSSERRLYERSDPCRREAILRDHQEEAERKHTSALRLAFEELEHLIHMKCIIPGEYRNNVGFKVVVGLDMALSSVMVAGPSAAGYVWQADLPIPLYEDLDANYRYCPGSLMQESPSLYGPEFAAHQQSMVPGPVLAVQQRHSIDQPIMTNGATFCDQPEANAAAPQLFRYPEITTRFN